LYNLVKELESMDVPIFFQSKVEGLRTIKSGFRFVVGHDMVQSHYFVNAGGLYSIDLRKQLDLMDLENYWVKGNYVYTNKKINYPALIYPVPLKKLKGLGTHITLDFDGKIKFGPDTEDTSQIDYSQNTSVLDTMHTKINHYFKNIDRTDLHLDYSGIRSKILHNNNLYSDFWVKQSLSGYFEFCGIDSPGLTSAPAIGEWLSENLRTTVH
jgi:L-2-hydroxyglutarate oxidase LhgO